MKRTTVLATAITAAAVLALGGGYAYSVATDRPLVGVAEATNAPLSVTVSASGTVTPARSRGVYPPAAGTLASVRVHDGDAVHSGQVLAVMDARPLRLAVARARAAHSAARAQAEAVANGVPRAIEHSAAGATLAAARSQLATARKNYAAYRSDYRDATSAQRRTMRPTLRTLRSAKATAAATLASAQASLARLSVAGQVSLARTAADQSMSATRRALRQAEADLAAAELVAPFGGTVRLPGTVEPGAGVTPGVAFATVVDPARMAFDAAVTETDIAAVEVGQPVTVTLDAFEEPFPGEVVRLATGPETTSTGSVAFAVRVSITPGEARLFEGMSGSADIVVESLPDTLVVPVESVLTTGDASTVFVLDADDVARTRQVTIGASTDTTAQVLEGLAAGDRVVTTGASTITDGQRVRTR